MNSFIIPKGYRRPSSLVPKFPIFLLLQFSKTYTWSETLLFTHSAIYRGEAFGRRSVNRLFGFSIWNFRDHSISFGWRPTKDLKAIEIVSLEYLEGQRKRTLHIATVELNQSYTFDIEWIPGSATVIYWVTQGNKGVGYVISPYKYKHKIAVTNKLNLCIGGSRVAPHDIQILRYFNTEIKSFYGERQTGRSRIQG